VPWKKYLAYNAISAFFFAPTFICLGYFFSKKIEPVVTGVQTFRHIVVFLIILVLGVSILLFVRKKFFLAEKAKSGDIS
jgi:membrane protein DedA with SNARE-associated domain